MKNRGASRHTGGAIYIACVLVLMYLPVLVVVLYSFNSNTSRLPITFTGFTLDWYTELLKGTRGFGDALMTSLLVAVLSVAASCLLGTLGAIGMAERRVSRARRTAYAAVDNLTTLPVMIPEILMGMALMAAFNMIRLPGGLLSLVLAHTTFCVPYVYIIVSGRLKGMDPAMVDAARDLGASPFYALRTVTLPIITPAILSGALLAAAMSMDDFVISFFVSDTVTLPRKVYASIKVGVSPQVNALCSLMLTAVFMAAALSRLTLRGRKSAR